MNNQNSYADHLLEIYAFDDVVLEQLPILAQITQKYLLTKKVDIKKSSRSKSEQELKAYMLDAIRKNNWQLVAHIALKLDKIISTQPSTTIETR